MKYSLYILILLANVSFADYSNHPEANDLIDSLVNDHDFERSYVIKVLETAQKQNKILDSMSSPAEFTWTWDRYKKLFLEEKRIVNGSI
jgi:membrane-bound lytic murein transglycosylase B